MSELKPCPFCGRSDVIFNQDTDIVHCRWCGGVYDSLFLCDASWNTRPIEDALNARIAELEAERRWIPVSERLPKEKQSVLALDRTGTAYHWEYSKCLSNIFVGYYTHWIPLPEPPEVKE